LPRYERITFEKNLISLPGKPTAELVSPGHPLLEAVTDLITQQTRELLKQGAVLVAENDYSEDPRLLVSLEHSVHDARTTTGGEPRVVSRRLHFVELSADGEARSAGYAPHLDYRPLKDEERPLVAALIESSPFARDAESMAMDWAIQHLAPEPHGRGP